MHPKQRAQKILALENRVKNWLILFTWNKAKIGLWTRTCVQYGNKGGRYSHQTGVLRGWRKNLERSQIAIKKKILAAKAEILVLKQEATA